MASDPAQSIDQVLARLRQLHPRLIDLSLVRMHRLLADIGHPERRLPKVIHVAGRRVIVRIADNEGEQRRVILQHREAHAIG